MAPNILVRLALAAALTISPAASTPSETPSFGPSLHVAAQRGPQIFNAVYDSLRKWGSSVHPNGMSLLLATVPEGVLFHHGNTRNATPTGLDWLAYEIPHAEIFARPEFGRRRSSNDLQKSLDDSDDSIFGWLHTYRTTRPLQFLYIDGMSGNKANTGMIDTQDLILRTEAATAATRPPGPPGEYQRALDICALCAEWQLQGVIRTEGAGTEVIKCDFFDGLEEVQVVQRSRTRRIPEGRHDKGSSSPPGSGVSPGDGPRHPGDSHPRWGRIPTTGPETPELGFRDVGASRTLLDYGSMVSAFFFPVNLTNPDEKAAGLPRLVETTAAQRLAIKHYLGRILAERRNVPLALGPTWRDVADLVVRRYGEVLPQVANQTTASSLSSSLDRLLDVFTDYSVANAARRDADARQRCTYFYLQAQPLRTETDRLLHAAFTAVNERICGTLFDASNSVAGVSGSDEAAAVKHVQAALRELIQDLDWSVFDRKLTAKK